MNLFYSLELKLFNFSGQASHPLEAIIAATHALRSLILVIIIQKKDWVKKSYTVFMRFVSLL